MIIKTNEIYFSLVTFYQDLMWTREDLKKAKQMLEEWDGRDNSYYKSMWKDTVKFDKAEREHLRNTIEFYEGKFKDDK